MVFRVLVWCVVAFACGFQCAAGQDFRVVSVIYDVHDIAADRKPSVIATSLSLFHRNKVYDYIDSAHEVIVFEPGRNQFTVLTPSRSLAAVVDFDEVKHLLKVAKSETKTYLDQLKSSGDPSWRDAEELLSFHLDPDFTEHFDVDQNRLELVSPLLRYTVDCVEPPTTEIMNAYLTYADWIVRLNFVLSPHSLPPNCRLMLNESLRQQQKFPVRVELETRGSDSVLHRRAEHRIGRQLDELDRSLISRWERLLKSETTRRTTLRVYQRAIIASAR